MIADEVRRARQARMRHAFGGWQVKFSLQLQAERGRASRLADYLGVSRQEVSRWFVRPSRSWTKIPAWAAVHANIWSQALVTPQADKLIHSERRTA